MNNYNYLNTPMPASQQPHQRRRLLRAYDGTQGGQTFKRPTRRRVTWITQGDFGDRPATIPRSRSVRDPCIPSTAPRARPARRSGSPIPGTKADQRRDAGLHQPRARRRMAAERQTGHQRRLKYANDNFDLQNTNTPGKNFWFAAAQQEFCYNPKRSSRCSFRRSRKTRR